MRYEPDTPYTGLKAKPVISYDQQEPGEFSKAFFKFFNYIGVAFLILSSAFFAYQIANYGVTVGAIIMAGMAAIPIVYAVVAYPNIGILILLMFAYFIMFALRIIKGAAPLGTLMDGLILLLVFGFFVKQKYEKNWKILKSPISTLIIVWFLYLIFQAANPTTEARMAWVYTVRGFAGVTLTYFIFTYYIRTVDFLRIIFKVWMMLSVFAAIYALKQEYIGFFQFEQDELNDPLVAQLLFINGVWRKFSIFSDPVAFAYNMVISSIFCICMLRAPISRKAKFVYGAIAALCITTMLYSGTRGAFVLIPAAMVLYVVMHINKKTLIFASVGAFLFLALINMPTSNVTLYRFQSAFKPSDDASFNVRKKNQKMIQPYIQTHPLGGGLGATGVWGVRFAPHSFLAQFPPDSGYVRVAVELGSIGILIFCSLMFTILRQGIRNYYQIKDPELKIYCLAMTLVIFALNIGNYPQEALVQFPTNIYFYLFVAIINITLRIDKEKNDILSPVKPKLLIR